MSTEPWLDGLTEDWITDHQEPPKPQDENGPKFSGWPKGIARPSHNSGARKPSRDSAASRAVEPEPRDKHSPRPPASSQNDKQVPCSDSNRILQTQTVQVRHGSSAVSEDIPEWRRRILQGEAAGEGADLFAPIGLERIFDPPRDVESASARRTRHSPQTPAPTNIKEALSESAANKSRSNPDLPFPRQPDRQDNRTSNQQEQTDVDSAVTAPPKRDSTRLVSRLDARSFTDARVRTASGAEELRNEGFTPIPPPATDGSELEEVDSAEFSSIHVTGDFYNRHGFSTAKNTDNNAIRGEGNAVEATPEMTSQSLPEGLSMGTQDASSLGGFVSMRRGGYSNEGSFLKRPLSPSSMPSQRLSSSVVSSQAAKRSSQTRKCDEVTRPSEPTDTHPTPPPSNIASVDSGSGNHDDEAAPEYVNGRRSASPLKLFAAHDTFTNNRLLRRMGQFEENVADEADEMPLPSTDAHDGTSKHPPPHQISPNPPGDFESKGAGSPTVNATGATDFAKSTTSPRKGSQQGHQDKSQQADWLKRQKVAPGETKRARNSPTKDSAPKRRRTLQNSGSHHEMWHEPLLYSSEFVSHIETENTDIGDLHEEGSQDGSPSKRPASGGCGQAALRPSSSRKAKPTLSRPTSSKTDSGLSGHNPSRQPPDSNEAGIRRAPEGSREGSITTQDFLDEATKIMDFIRSRGRLKTGLADVVESDIENADCMYEDESSEEEFSRPPSREIAHLPRLRVPRSPNPRIVSHLKKFEEDDEQDMFMGASAMSLRLRAVPGSSKALPSHHNDGVHDGEGTSGVHSKNIRLRKSFGERSRRHSFSGESLGTLADNTPGIQSGIPSQRSISGACAGLSRSSTGSSGTRGIISSDMVAHLIPGRVGTMVYDGAEQRWVKGGRGRRETNDQANGDVTEEDPFNSIPDLSVDELQELINTRDFAAGGTTATQTEDKHQNRPNDEVPTRPDPTHAETEARPATKDSASSVQSKSTRFTGSYPKPDTRATSWATEDMEPLTKPSKIGETSTTTAARPEEAEHEVRVHYDGPTSTLPFPRRSEMQPRVVTANFPSSLEPSHDNNAVGDNYSPAEGALPSSPHPSATKTHPQRSLPESTPTKQSSPRRTFSERRSPGKQILNGRPISRIDEQNEDSVEGGDAELSVVPAPAHEDRSAISHRTPGRNLDTSYSFHLTPLPDFTVNQPDDTMRLEVSYVAERTNPQSLRQVHGAFALAAETLIKHITDVEPFEVYWEHLRQMDLREKGLITLLKLNQYCPRLEDLNAADNRIGQLSGVPPGIRSLNVARNCLSNMTAWAHLSHLQYVDVSGNELENLDGFSGLVHLRSLKANGNRINSVNGVLQLDGLLSLELKDNALSSVDFGESELFRLKNLDLAGNQLERVENINCLPSLESLDLRDNSLCTFTSDSTVQCLRSLRLSRNRIIALDVSLFPELRLLYVDVNHLSAVRGLDACDHLDTLSMREQTCASDAKIPLAIDIDMGNMPELRKLYLSSNKLSPTILTPRSPAPDLQFLDIASCSLEHLPRGFGGNFPNLRALNLNFNALPDVSGLEGVTRLSRLSLVGNRLTRLRRLCQVLRDVGGKTGALRKVDLRGNPITVGFYPAPLLGSGRRILRVQDKRSQDIVRVSGDDDEDDNDDLELPPLDGCADIAVRAGDDAATALERRREYPSQTEDDAEIDDPYTIPPADPVADQRYLVRLDESTRLRRRVVELMVHAATSGRLKVLDGLDLAVPEGDGSNGKRVRKDWVWARLEELGVLKKRAVVLASG